MVKKNKNTKNIWIIVSIVGVVAVLYLVSSYGGFLSTKTFSGGSSGTIPSPVGYYDFNKASKLDQTYLGNAFVRIGLVGRIGSNGKITFDPQGEQGKLIEKLLVDGKKVVPAIRIKLPDNPTCDSAPSDLDRTSTLRPGGIYSEQVKIFAHSFAQAYKGKFPIVVFGNEENTEHFFCAANKSGDQKSIETMAASDYIRILSTFKKAYQQVDPQAQVTDGGMQGDRLGWLVIEDYLDKDNTAKALDFHKKFTGKSVDIKILKVEMAKMATRQSFVRAKALLGLNIYSFGDLAKIPYTFSV